MGFFSSIGNFFTGAFKSIIAPFKGIAAQLGLYTPASVKRERASIERMQSELKASTARQKRDAEAVAESGRQRGAAMRGRREGARKRRSMLFAGKEEQGLEKTLG